MSDLEKLSKKEVEDMILGVIGAIISNKDYFYKSTVDSRYSKLTENGKTMLFKSMGALLPLLSDSIDHELINRAKEMTWDTLKKGETD